MASWKDSLRPASFRGVAFFVEGHEATFGRRQASHEFPDRDDPYTEDLGRKAREYSVDAYLVGDDYPAQKQKIIAACETAGEAELVHPYLGSVQVVCTGLKVTETSAEQRICKLSLTFREGGTPKYPADATDATSAVTAAANTVQDAAKGGFIQGFLTGGMPSFVVDAAQGQLAGLSSLLGTLPVNPLAEAQAVADFFGEVRGLASDALQLITQPAAMAEAIIGVVSGIRDVFGSRADAALRAVMGGNGQPYVGPTDTPNRRQQQANTNAVTALVRRAAVAERAKLAIAKAIASAQAIQSQTASDAPDDAAADLFRTREEAVAVREEMTELLDVEMENPTTTDDEYSAMSALRAEVVRSIPAGGLQLPRVASITPRATLPSLVVAQQVYGSADRAVEIATRNHARHPGFIPGGEPLQVITGG